MAGVKSLFDRGRGGIAGSAVKPYIQPSSA